MGGTTSSYLHEVQGRLFGVNRELQLKNEELAETVAQLRSVNVRLEDLDRLRKEYLRNVSHEFRTPLTVIRGYSEFLRDDGLPLGSSLPEVMHVLIESCDQMIDMVETLIEVGRIEQEGERTLDVRRYDLKEVAAASVRPLRLLAEKKGVALSFDFPGEPLYVHGDGSLLHQLVRKLVDNALKYSRPGARVVVRGRAHGDDGTLEVEDSGIGIAPEHLPQIFEKFYMADGGLARRRGGSGVGLYLVREIVRLHKGTIDVRSAPGQGSVFSVRLPRQFRGGRPDAAPV
jgi:signal transduction histidine kinase